MHRGAVLSLFALLGCRSPTPLVRADPVDAGPEATAPPTPTKLSTRDRWALVAGRVVDLDAPVATHELGKHVKGEAVRGDRGYVVGADDVLRAYDLPSGKVLWSVTPPHACRSLVAGPRWLHCVDEAKVTAYSPKDGAATPLPGALPPWAAVFETRARTLVFGATKLSVYDATLSPLTSTSLSASYPPRPFATPAGPCFADRGVGFGVTCFDEAGVLRHATSFPPTPAKAGASFPLDSVHRTDPTGPTWTLHASTFGPIGPAVLVQVPASGAAPFEVMRVVEHALAPALREDGALEGLVVRRGKTLALLDEKGATRWTAKIDPYGETGHAVVVGDTLVLAIHSPISSGCSVVGLHRTTGAVLYQADVLQLPIAHSAYLNDVDLEVRGKTVRLSGHEAGIRYEQLFDVATGKRLFAEARLRW